MICKPGPADNGATTSLVMTCSAWETNVDRRMQTVHAALVASALNCLETNSGAREPPNELIDIARNYARMLSSDHELQLAQRLLLGLWGVGCGMHCH